MAQMEELLGDKLEQVVAVIERRVVTVSQQYKVHVPTRHPFMQCTCAPHCRLWRCCTLWQDMHHRAWNTHRHKTCMLKWRVADTRCVPELLPHKVAQGTHPMFRTHLPSSVQHTRRTTLAINWPYQRSSQSRGPY